jgi:hypothetical protein
MRSWLLDQLAFPDGGIEPGPLEATFLMACKFATESGLASAADEETMTGALLGAMASTVPWCVAALAADGVTCSWARYRKGGRRYDSESQTGGDFALVIEMPKGCTWVGGDAVRLAVVQAKKIYHGKIKIHHAIEATETAVASTQMQALVEHGRSILTSLNRADLFEAYTWLHYASYGEEGIQTRSLSLFKAEYDQYGQGTKPGPVSAHDSGWTGFEVMLSAGCTIRAKEKNDPPGWLTLPRSDAEAVLGDLLEVMDVHVADMTGEDRGPLFNNVDHVLKAVQERKRLARRAERALARYNKRNL